MIELLFKKSSYLKNKETSVVVIFLLFLIHEFHTLGRGKGKARQPISSLDFSFQEPKDNSMLFEG